MPLWIEWLAAEGTGWATGRHDSSGSLHEAPCCSEGETHSHEVRSFRVVIIDLCRDLVVLARVYLGARLHLDHAVGVVPRQRDGAHPELLAERLIERPLVILRHRPCRGCHATPFELRKDGPDPVGEDHHLHLLQRDRDDAGPRHSLKEEGAFARRTDGAADESVRGVEDVNATGHGSATLARRSGPARRGAPEVPGAVPRNIKRTMLTVHSDLHRGHVYAHETVAGFPVPAWEVPARAEAIIDALRRDGGHDERAAREWGPDPILAVHDVGMLRYLEDAWSAWVSANRHLERLAIVPDTMLLDAYRDGMGAAVEPSAPDGRVGYWCFDTMTPIVAGTYIAARAAVDVALEASQAVLEGARAAYGLCRPPGHHAARRMFGGYCYLNNAAVSAEWLVRQTGSSIGILDLDVHHGNGTQSIFYERADVAYASLHSDPDRLYPYFSGRADETGAGQGRGATLNLPLAAATADDAYLSALDGAVEWLLDRTSGPLVVSLGLDTYVDDPIGDLALTMGGFERCGQRVASAGRPLVILQEGGYAVADLGEAARRWLAGADGRR